jgi:hypothetical protein
MGEYVANFSIIMLSFANFFVLDRQLDQIHSNPAITTCIIAYSAYIQFRVDHIKSHLRYLFSFGSNVKADRKPTYTNPFPVLLLGHRD